MELDRLRDQASACLRLWAPELGDASPLVEECLASGLKSFSHDFVCSLSPQIWARVTIIYQKHFLDTQSDVSVGEMLAEVLRDSIETQRIDFLTQKLAVKRRFETQGRRNRASSLTLVKK